MTEAEQPTSPSPRKSINIAGLISVSDEGGSVTFVPSFEGRRCPYLFLRDDRARRAAGLQMIQGNLKHVQAALQLLIERQGTTEQPSGPGDPELTIQQALWFSSVITYGKCFTQAKGRRFQLGKEYLRGLSTEEQRLHDELMNIRHTYIAHGGETTEEHGNVVVLLNPDEQKKEILAVAPIVLSQTSVNPKRAAPYLIVVCKVAQNVKTAAEKVLDTIFDEQLALPIEALYEKAGPPPDVPEEHIRPGGVSFDTATGKVTPHRIERK